MNEIGEKRPETFITPDTSIGALVYVDDIAVAGSVSKIVETGKNIREMEKRKKYTFNVDKTNIVRIGKRKNKVEAIIELKKGQVTVLEKYKSLGNWINERGSMTDQKEEIESRTEATTSRII